MIYTFYSKLECHPFELRVYNTNIADSCKKTRGHAAFTIVVVVGREYIILGAELQEV